MKTITYRAGDATIVLDDVVGEMVRNVIEDRAGYAVRAITAHLERLESEAKAQWPVKTGESKAAFTQGVRIEASKVVAYLSNNAKYVYYIKGRKQGRKRSWTEVVIKPDRKARAELVELAAAELIATQKVS